MAETVYVLGAGINRSIRDNKKLRPPLATDLFKQALRHDMLDEQGIEELKELFAYVKKYWKLSVEDLREQPFDLEACFTLLQQQRLEAAADGDRQREEKTAQLEDQLASLLTKFLAYIEGLLTMDLMKLGERVLEEQAAVLTFNYDTIIEKAIERAAGKNETTPPANSAQVPDELLSYSSSNWNRALAYGVRFEEVELQQVGVTLDPVPGERFYEHPCNSLYDQPVLKLHGSINWFVHTSRRIYPHPYGHTKNPKAGKILLSREFRLIKYGFGPPDQDGWALRPLIVTPALHKELREGLIGEAWRRAREELSSCRRLVVAGYSFPATDFAMRRLFLEAFAESSPEEFVSINPDQNAAKQAADLCHVRRPIVREDLEEFLAR